MGTPRPRPRLSDYPGIFPAGLILAVLLTATCLVCCGKAQGGEGRWITAEVTAYAGNCPLCETTGVTANGTHVDDVPYAVAASPDLPFRARVFIPRGAGYLDVSRDADRWFTVDDRGGALRSEWLRSGITRLDLRYRTHWSARQFGRKLMLVYVQN